MIGFQALERYHDLHEGWTDIATFVDASARGQGIGKALFEKTFEAAEALGIGVLRAVIRAKNAQAIAYYRACGFILTDGYSRKAPAQQGADKVNLTRRLSGHPQTSPHVVDEFPGTRLDRPVGKRKRR